MECPRCHHRIVPGVLFCPECEAPLRVMWEETNPMGSAVWEYDTESGQTDADDDQSTVAGQDKAEKAPKLSLPVNRELKPRS